MSSRLAPSEWLIEDESRARATEAAKWGSRMTIECPASSKLPNLHAAITVWQDEKDRLDLMLEAAETAETLDAWLGAREANDEKLRRAFYEETKERNHWDVIKDTPIYDLFVIAWGCESKVA